MVVKERVSTLSDTSRRDVTKAKCKICVKTFSLSNMGEMAVRSHASGKKHQAAVTLSQTGSVSHFFGAKCETTPGLSSTGKPEEPSTSSSHDAGHTQGIRKCANNQRECIN